SPLGQKPGHRLCCAFLLRDCRFCPSPASSAWPRAQTGRGQPSDLVSKIERRVRDLRISTNTCHESSDPHPARSAPPSPGGRRPLLFDSLPLEGVDPFPKLSVGAHRLSYHALQIATK